jgi:hypothetical protein
MEPDPDNFLSFSAKNLSSIDKILLNVSEESLSFPKRGCS